MYLQEVEVLKEIPGYKALLKAVIKSQIQMLVRDSYKWAAAWQNQQNNLCTQQRLMSLGIYLPSLISCALNG